MSKKKDTQTQCKLVKDVIHNDDYPLEFGGMHRGVRHSELTQICWIPTKYAVKGSIIKLKGEDDVWVDGWKVVEVYSTEETAKVVEQAHAHTRQRGTSDI